MLKSPVTTNTNPQREHKEGSRSSTAPAPRRQGHKLPDFYIPSSNFGMIFTMASSRLLEKPEVQAGSQQEVDNPGEGDG